MTNSVSQDKKTADLYRIQSRTRPTAIVFSNANLREGAAHG